MTDLRRACKHGRWDAHTWLPEGADPESSIAWQECLGGAAVTGHVINVESVHPMSLELDHEWQRAGRIKPGKHLLIALGVEQ